MSSNVFFTFAFKMYVMSVSTLQVSIAIILVLLCGKFGLPLCLGLFEVLFKFLRKIIPYR